MSVGRSFAHDLLGVLLVGPLLMLSVGLARAGDVSRIHAEAKEGQVVTLVGHVVSVSRNVVFTLEDASGDRILAEIPDHLQRTVGTPEMGETIRVSGKYDHKTLLDGDKSKTADRETNWGIRVARVERNVPDSGRNPAADPATLQGQPDSKSAPAAPSTAQAVATPKLGKELKTRMSAARKRVLAARGALDDAKAESARGAYRKVAGPEKAALAESEGRAQREVDEATAAIGPLVAEAREAGADPKAIELYETGITPASH